MKIKNMRSTKFASAVAFAMALTASGARSAFAAEGDGDNVVTTIDCTAQAALQEALAKYADTNDTGKAWGVVMEVKTGAIRAVVDRCSVSCHCYEAGGVLMPFTAAIAWDAGVAKLDTMYSTARDDARYYTKLPGDGNRVWPEVMLVGDALVKASNIVFGKLSDDVGQERMYLGLRSFGFGEKPGSGFARETEGILPDCRKRPWDRAAWSRVGIGQFVGVTALQLARGYAILANGGIDVGPCTRAVPNATNRVVSAEAAGAICRTLERVVTPEGTARRAAVKGVRVAGKTGTALRRVNGKYLDGCYYATFAGFFPVEDPKYVIVTTFETKKCGNKSMHRGGLCSAMAFAEIVKKLKGAQE